jgi:peptidoglycan biosynthesis protein MviN/MurJ (putative lipid II flippase)
MILSIFKSSLKVSSISFLTQVLSIVNVIQIISLFGTSLNVDLYYLVLSISLYFSNILGQLFKNILIPQLFAIEDNEERNFFIKFLHTLIILFVTGLIIISFLFFPVSGSILGSNSIILIYSAVLVSVNLLISFYNAILFFKSNYTYGEYINLFRIILQIFIILLLNKNFNSQVLILSLLIPLILSLILLFGKTKIGYIYNLNYEKSNQIKLFLRNSIKTFLVLALVSSQNVVSNVFNFNIGDGLNSIYNYSQKISVIPSIIFNGSFLTILLVKLSSNKSNQSQFNFELLSKLLYLISVIFSFFVGIVFLNTEYFFEYFLLNKFNSDFSSYFTDYVNILLLASFFQIMYSIILRDYFSKNKVNRSLYISIIGFILYFFFLLFFNFVGLRNYSVPFANVFSVLILFLIVSFDMGYFELKISNGNLFFNILLICLTTFLSLTLTNYFTNFISLSSEYLTLILILTKSILYLAIFILISFLLKLKYLYILNNYFIYIKK